MNVIDLGARLIASFVNDLGQAEQYFLIEYKEMGESFVLEPRMGSNRIPAVAVQTDLFKRNGGPGNTA